MKLGPNVTEESTDTISGFKQESSPENKDVLTFPMM